MFSLLSETDDYFYCTALLHSCNQTLFNPMPLVFLRLRLELSEFYLIKDSYNYVRSLGAKSKLISLYYGIKVPFLKICF